MPPHTKVCGLIGTCFLDDPKLKPVSHNPILKNGVLIYGHNKECPTMHSLIEDIDGDILCLDAGFVDRELTKKIFELGIIPFIFPKKNLNLNGSIYWKKMFLELFYDTQNWLKIYNQRSHTESFHSAFKRKNKPLMKFNSSSKLVQLTARIIINNLRKQNYYSMLEN